MLICGLIGAAIGEFFFDHAWIIGAIIGAVIGLIIRACGSGGISNIADGIGDICD